MPCSFAFPIKNDKYQTINFIDNVKILKAVKQTNWILLDIPMPLNKNFDNYQNRNNQ